MPTFSTDNLPTRDRFAHWREERAKNIFGVTIELERERQLDFSGRFSALSVGGATLVELHASPYRVWRSEDDIARTPSDALCIYQQIDGGGAFDVRGAEFVVRAGQIATSHSDLPYRTQPTNGSGYHLRLLKIPFARCRPLMERNVDLSARLLAAEPGLTALFSSYFDAFVQQAPHLTGAGAEAAVQTLAQLAIVARGGASSQEERGRDAVRTSQLQAARQSIEQNLHRHDLTPATAAGLLGISVRRLHMLFEPAGISFTRYLLARRLERSRVLLVQMPGRKIADVAFACGFDSLSTFYRGFRAAYGVSPADFRQSALKK